MVKKPRFNICKLRPANADVEGLLSRSKQNISDPLQHSSLYWLNNRCFTPENGDKRMWENFE